MELSIKERLVLLNVLPSQETYDNMLVLRELMGELGFNEADHDDIGLTEEDGNVSWDEKKAVLKEVSIGLVAYDLIKKGFKKLDSEKLITLDLMPTYKRFVEDEVSIKEEAHG